MDVTVVFVSPLNSSTGVSQTVVTLLESSTVASLAVALRERFPSLAGVAQMAMYMVDGKLMKREAVLREGDRVLMMQILGGG